MSISRPSAHSAQANNVAITTPTAGDLILVFAHRDGSTTAPTLPAGYKELRFGGANTNSARIGWKFSDGTETGSGTWTNATSVEVGIYRGVDRNCPFGDVQAGGGASTTLSFTGLTMHRADGTSWVVGFAAHRTATNVGTNAPTGMGTRSSATDIAIFDTGGAVSSWSTQTASVNANSGWRTYTVELREASTNTAPSPDPLIWWKHSSESGETGNDFKIHFPHLSLSNNCLVLAFWHTTGVSVSSITDSNGSGASWVSVTPETASNGNRDLRVYTLRGCAAGISWVKVTLSGSTSNFGFVVGEFKGVVTSGTALDVSTHTTTSTLPLKSGTLTPTQAGNLYIQVAVDTQQTFGSLSSECLGFAPDPSFALLSADIRNGIAAQYWVQSGSSAAINPGLAVLQPSNPDSYAVVTIALKMDGSGTSRPAGLRRVREYQHSPFLNAVEPIQMPTSGNLAIVCTTVPDNQSAMSAGADVQANTYTRKNLDTTAGQLLYAPNASASLNNRLTVTYAAAGYYCRLIDVIGADPSPYDAAQEHFATGSIGAAGDVTNAPSGVVPSTANGMTLVLVPVGTGPYTECYGPANAFTDVDYYTGESDAGSMNWGDMIAHHFYTSTASQTWNFHTNVPGATSWAASSFGFKEAAAGGTTVNLGVIPSSEALGPPAATQSASAVAVPSAESLGGPTALQTGSTGLIPSGESVPAITFARVFSPGIAILSVENFVALTALNSGTAGAVPSGESFGTATGTQAASIGAVGSAEQTQVMTFARVFAAGAVGSAENFYGVTALNSVASGVVPSGELFYLMVSGATVNVSLSVVPTEEKFFALTALNAAASGVVPSGELFAAPVGARVATLGSVSSAEQAQVMTWARTFAPGAIPSGEELRGASGVLVVSFPGVPSGERFFSISGQQVGATIDWRYVMLTIQENTGRFGIEERTERFSLS